MKKITVLGNFSGRNAGDAAILGCLLKDITDLYSDVKFYIPTINTKFVSEAFGQYNVKPVSLLPWNFSVKILGVPVFTTTLSSDLILVTDAILFDRKLYNPLFNYLWTLSKLLPMARKKGIPVVLYNSSLGPVTRPAGRKSLQNVVNSADMIILRDAESVELLKKENISHPPLKEGADCALNAKAVNGVRFQEICTDEDLFQSDRPVIGFNVNSYVDAFVRKNGKNFGRENLVDLYAQTVDRTIENLHVDIVFVETQHMDMGIANEVLAKIKNTEHVRLVSNKKYSYEDICSILQRFELFVGMRTHSLILSSAMGTPPLGILTYPKNRGYMRTIGLENNLIEFKDLSVDAYSTLIATAFKNRISIKKKMLPNVEREKIKARSAAEKLEKYFY